MNTIRKMIMELLGRYAWYMTHDDYAWFSDDEYEYITFHIFGVRIVLERELGDKRIKVYVGKSPYGDFFKHHSYVGKETAMNKNIKSVTVIRSDSGGANIMKLLESGKTEYSHHNSYTTVRRWLNEHNWHTMGFKGSMTDFVATPTN